ncbi:MAG: hypothetical protein ACLGIK_11010, partial [Gemmatimonadota bacterium]
DRFHVVGLTANRSAEALEKLVDRWTPAMSVLVEGEEDPGGAQAAWRSGRDALLEMVTRPDVRVVINALVGAAGLEPTLAALEATLALYRDPQRALREVPTLAMLTADAETVRARCESLGVGLHAVSVAFEIVPSEATVGGGAFPSARIPSWALALPGDPVALDRRLRLGDDAVVGRIERDRLLLDLRSIPAPLDPVLLRAISGACAE